MRILKSRNSRDRFRSQLGRQLLAGLFTVAAVGSPFGQPAAAECTWPRGYESSPVCSAAPPSPAALSPTSVGTPPATPAAVPTATPTAAPSPAASAPSGGGSDDGCQKTYVELSNQCVALAKASDASAQAQVATLDQSPGAIHSGAGTLTSAAQSGQRANAATSAACAGTLQQCKEICGKAVNFHNKNASLEEIHGGSMERAKLQRAYAATAQDNIKRCEDGMGTVATQTGISATTLGLAAAAAGGIFLLTKSSGSKDKSSGGDTTTPADPTSVDPISTDPDSGFQTYEDMYKYWTTNKCRSVLSGTITASEDIVDNCTAISKDPSFSTTLASLGTCSDVDNYGRPDCFDRINNYCLQIAPEKRFGDPTCAGFCVAKPQADSCTYVVGVMTSSYGGTGTVRSKDLEVNAQTDPTSSSSGSPFNTATSGSYYPRVQQAPSGAPGYISATQTQYGLSMSPRIGTPTSGTRTLASSAGQPDCSSPQMMNKPECEAPMTKYCSQYGTQGKGCPEFCKTHKNVCKK